METYDLTFERQENEVCSAVICEEFKKFCRLTPAGLYRPGHHGEGIESERAVPQGVPRCIPEPLERRGSTESGPEGQRVCAARQLDIVRHGFSLISDLLVADRRYQPLRVPRSAILQRLPPNGPRYPAITVKDDGNHGDGFRPRLLYVPHVRCGWPEIGTEEVDPLLRERHRALILGGN